jgi:membrane dipeptidase
MTSSPLVAAALLLAAAGGGVPAAAQSSAELLERARGLHAEAPLIDGHNDLPWEIRQRAQGDLTAMDPDGPLPRQHTDVARLRAGGVGAVFWAAYVPVSRIPSGSAAFALDQIGLIKRMTERSPWLEMAYTADDVVRIHREGRVASLIGIEGGHAIENSLDALRQFHELGVRYLTLTHSSSIDWADAATDAARHGGLSPFGEEVVREMNRMGMLVDLSHVSDATMMDALRVSEAPVIFSHSSARALADHPRNVPDSVLAALPRNGGVVMINFFSGFVEPRAVAHLRGMPEVQRRFREQHPGDAAAGQRAYDAWRRDNPVPRGTVGTVADHIDHVVRIAGIDHVGLGSDYDGVSTLPVGLEDVSTFPALTMELMRRGYPDEDVRKILGGNVLRAMRQAEATAARLQRERAPSAAVIDVMDGRPARR